MFPCVSQVIEIVSTHNVLRPVIPHKTVSSGLADNAGSNRQTDGSSSLASPPRRWLRRRWRRTSSTALGQGHPAARNGGRRRAVRCGCGGCRLAGHPRGRPVRRGGHGRGRTALPLPPCRFACAEWSIADGDFIPCAWRRPRSGSGAKASSSMRTPLRPARSQSRMRPG